MNKDIGFIFVLILLLSFNAFAKELPYIYKGARPLGMGGAFTALSDDANALFYNPAGLANIKEPRLSPFNLEFEFGQKAYKFNKDAIRIDLDKAKDVGKFLHDNLGDYGHLSTSFFPSYSKPNLAFGIIGSIKSNPQVIDRQYPKLAMDTIEDAGACAGYAQTFLDNSLLVGSNLKYLYRRSLEHEYTVADITTHGFKKRLKDDFETGGGILLDLGIIYKIQPSQEETAQEPIQLGMSVNNLIGNKLGNAADLNPHLDLGVSKHFGDLTIAADYVDVFGQLGDDKDIAKRIHLGLEYSATKTLKLRTGVNQGYLTLGVGIDTTRLQFDMLTYAEEVGSYSGQQKDRRYLLRFGLVF